jgi:hypothetical protein
MSISREELLRFLMEKRGAAALLCRACSAGDMLINTTSTTREDPTQIPAKLGINWIDENSPPTRGMHLYYALSCGNCAFTEFYHSLIVEEWLNAHPLLGGLS